MRKLLAIIALLSAAATLHAQQPLGIALDGEDIFLTVPDSLLGRRMLLSTVVTGSESPYMPLHRDISESKVYTFARVDSTLVLQGISQNGYCIDGDESIVRALGNSHTAVVEHIFKIESADSLGYRINAGDLFAPSSKAVVDLEGLGYAQYAVTSASYSADKSALTGVWSRPNAVCVARELSFDLKLRTLGLVFQLDGNFPTTFEAVTSLTLLPAGEMEHKEADRRIGTYNVPVTGFASDRGSEERQWVRRWNLSEGIDIYVDTLLTAAQSKAVCEAFGEWNKAFECIGLGSPICVRPYPSDSTFSADDPLVSVVALSGSESSVSATFLSDGADRILANRFYIPSEYVSSVRRRSAFTIAYTDERYRPYDLCEDAVCEVLKADFIRLTGLCLGISQNLAASYAYTPAQVRDVQFVSEHGFAASVTDDVLFNYLATAEDRARGLKTVVDRVGAYDVYALDWIYGDGQPDSAPEHFYAPAKGKVSDFRVRKYDLTNDPAADFDAGQAQLRYVADNGENWITDAPDTYRMLYIDWLWLRGNNLLYLLTSNVGGYAYNSPVEGSDLPKYVALPEKVQKQAVADAFAYMRDFAWLDASALVKIAGANPNVSDFCRTNAFKMVNATYRFGFVAFAERYAGSSYTVRDYLDDLEKYSFKNAVKGRFPVGETMIVGQYVSFLASNVSASGSDAQPGMSEVAYEYLLRARTKLNKCRKACKNEQDRLLVDYLISFTDDKISFNK